MTAHARKSSKLRKPSEAPTTARVFWTGRSQAVRLPKEFRFDVDEVAIRREGDRIILEPIMVERDEQGWPLVLWEMAGADPAFDTGERPERHERGDVLSSRR